MTVFGNSIIGTNYSAALALTMFGLGCTCPADGKLTKISVYIQSTTYNENYYAAIYDDTKAMLGQSQEVNVLANQLAWRDFNFTSPITLTNGKHVYLCVTSGVNGGTTTYETDGGIGGFSMLWNYSVAPYNYASPPNPLVSPSIFDGYRLPITGTLQTGTPFKPKVLIM